ncbi:hypothetical protein C0992_008834 [Termitomyces sp. T32_za158]|nr:hypothetical protein C0992_008834 [Termitomyces sp. T32_za158]
MIPDDSHSHAQSYAPTSDDDRSHAQSGASSLDDDQSYAQSCAPSPDYGSGDDTDDELAWESKKFFLDEETIEYLGLDTEVEELGIDQAWDNEDLTEKFIQTARQLGDDPNDEDWLP